MKTAMIGVVTYRLIPARPDDDRVPYMLADGIRWAVIACYPGPGRPEDAGWITTRSRLRHSRVGRGPLLCYHGVDIEHLTGPGPLVYLRNVRLAGSGLRAIAAYHAALPGSGLLDGGAACR
jgi:hypothetical protein